MAKASTPKGVKTLQPKGADAYEHLKDTVGRLRTQSLFYEMRSPKYPAPFTLKDRDHEGRVSMYRIYMEIGDPTEYQQALALLGSWKHWKQLTSTDWFETYVSRWREELKTKFESARYEEMVEVAKTQKGTPQGVQATKWLAERYTQRDKPVRGRPSNAEKAKYLKNASEEDKLLKEEAERLGL
jgi:hypothetical protein